MPNKKWKNNFNQEIILTKLDKKILYKENIILQSLYLSATNKKIPANIIIELASIYGFQVDFQEILGKKFVFKLCISKDEMKTETGNILFANLILSGKITLSIILIKKEVLDIR